MNVLVTGGAGYIGSHAVKRLRELGHNVVVVDNLFRGHRAAVPDDVPFEQVDLLDAPQLTRVFAQHAPDCVMHFAALAYVGESVHDPLRYYHNNTTGTINLLRAMDEAGVRRMVFSSTCATYGEPPPDRMPMTEDLPQEPINPYGWSKLFVERILRDYAAAHADFTFIALRYFNVAGCAADGTIGEDHQPETHLIPILLEAALGKRDHVTVFGDDYATPDGTCIRDYIHVEDLVAAHAVAMDAMQRGDAGHTDDRRFFNLGIGRGYSVREVIESARRVTGVAFPVADGPRRAGDPPRLYANSDKIQRDLGWRPQYTQLDAIVQTAWDWFRTHPNGYGE